MKKLLLCLTSLGLVTTGSMSAVSCSLLKDAILDINLDTLTDKDYVYKQNLLYLSKTYLQNLDDVVNGFLNDAFQNGNDRVFATGGYSAIVERKDENGTLVKTDVAFDETYDFYVEPGDLITVIGNEKTHAKGPVGDLVSKIDGQVTFKYKIDIGGSGYHSNLDLSSTDPTVSNYLNIYDSENQKIIDETGIQKQINENIATIDKFSEQYFKDFFPNVTYKPLPENQTMIKTHKTKFGSLTINGETYELDNYDTYGTEESDYFTGSIVTPTLLGEGFLNDLDPLLFLLGLKGSETKTVRTIKVKQLIEFIVKKLNDEFKFVDNNNVFTMNEFRISETYLYDMKDSDFLKDNDDIDSILPCHIYFKANENRTINPLYLFDVSHHRNTFLFGFDAQEILDYLDGSK